MSKPTALRTEGTAKVLERFNISDTARKLNQIKSPHGIAAVITTKLQTGSERYSAFRSEKQQQKRKGSKHTQFHSWREKDKNTLYCVLRFHSCWMKSNHDGTRFRQMGAEIVQDSKTTTWRGVANYKIQTKCKGGVGANSISSLTIAAEERRDSLGLGFKIIGRSWVMNWGAQQGLGLVPF